jgi:hypothetical protein
VSSPIRARIKLVILALTLVALSEWLATMGIGGGVHTSLKNFWTYGDGFLSACLLASAITFASTRDTPERRMVYVVTAIVSEFAVLLTHPHAGYIPRYAGAASGGVAFAIGSFELARARDATRFLHWLEILIFPMLLLGAILPLELTVFLHPASLDGRMLVLEHALFGTEPSWFAGRLFAEHGGLTVFEMLIYVYLPTASSIIYVLERTSGRANDLQVGFITAGIIGIVMLHLAPVIGPAAFRPDYPDIVPNFDDALSNPYAGGMRWRNSIPSLHTTWSLLIYWHSRPHGPRARIFGGLWVTATIFAMLGLGEHYLADVAITLPFAVAMRATLATSIEPRLRAPAFAVGGFFYVTWLFVLRSSLIDSSFFVRGLALAGIASALVAERRLYEAPRGRTEPEFAPPAKWMQGAAVALALLLLVIANAYRSALAETAAGIPVIVVLGAAAGAAAAVAWRRLPPMITIAVAGAGFALSTLIGFSCLDAVPSYLADYAEVPYDATVVQPVVHFIVSALFLGPPAFFGGVALSLVAPRTIARGVAA